MLHSIAWRLILKIEAKIAFRDFATKQSNAIVLISLVLSYLCLKIIFLTAISSLRLVLWYYSSFVAACWMFWSLCFFAVTFSTSWVTELRSVKVGLSVLAFREPQHHGWLGSCGSPWFFNASHISFVTYQTNKVLPLPFYFLTVKLWGAHNVQQK
jgi:hypothetical protein